MNNAAGGSALAVLDARHPSGVSPAGPACTNCPSGSPDTYLIAPWSDLVDRSLPTMPPNVAVRPDGTIEFTSPQRNSVAAATLIVTLSPSLDILQQSVSDSFRVVHAGLERDGALAHGFAHCPWLRAPLRLWTPSHGWRNSASVTD